METFSLPETVLVTIEVNVFRNFSTSFFVSPVSFERVSIKNCEVLWQGTKSLNSIEGILALKFIILFESILIPLLLIITISTYNVLADERGFTIGILIFLACCYFMICAFNVRAVKTANRTDYIITDKEVIRIVKNRFKDQIPLDNIRGFQIKKTNLAFPGLNIGTIFFYDKIHKRPEMTFNDIDDLHEVKAILEQKIKFRLKISDDDKVSYFVQPKQA